MPICCRIGIQFVEIFGTYVCHYISLLSYNSLQSHLSELHKKEREILTWDLNYWCISFNLEVDVYGCNKNSPSPTILGHLLYFSPALTFFLRYFSIGCQRVYLCTPLCLWSCLAIGRLELFLYPFSVGLISRLFFLILSIRPRQILQQARWPCRLATVVGLYLTILIC